MPEFSSGFWPILRRAATVVFAIGILILLVIAAIYSVPQLVGGDRSYVVMSGSMEPTISAGDVIVVGSVAISDVQLGDVVTFDRGERFPTTHRVVEIEGSGSEVGLVTQGDANEDVDPEFVGESALVGRVQSIGGHLIVIPLFGHVVLFANTAGGMVLLVFVPLLLFALNEVYVRMGRPKKSAGTGDDVDGTGQSEDSAAQPLATEETVPHGGLAVGGLDLTLTMVALAVVVPYSGLMLVEHRQPLSAMVFAGGLVGLLLIVGLQLWIWQGSRRSGRSEPVASTDGGTPVDPESHESTGLDTDGGENR